MAGLFKEVWAADIKRRLFLENDFIKYTKDRSGMVKDGETLNISQTSTVTENQIGTIVYPLPVVNPELSNLAFNLTTFASPVIRVSQLLESQLRNDYRISVLGESLDQLAEDVADTFLHQFVKGDNALDTKQDKTNGDGQAFVKFVKTKGLATASSLHYGVDAVGRKMARLKDFSDMKLMFDSYGVPQAGRVAMISSQMATDIFGDEILKYRDPLGLDFNTAEIPKPVFGWRVIVRPRVCLFSPSGTGANIVMNSVNYAAIQRNPQKLRVIPNTVQGGALFFQKDTVFTAQGATNPFFQLLDPNYQSDTFSYNTRGMAGRERKDGLGCAVLLEDLVA